MHAWFNWADLARAREGICFFTGIVSLRTVRLSFALQQLEGNQPTGFYSGKLWLISKFYFKTSQTHGQHVFMAIV